MKFSQSESPLTAAQIETLGAEFGVSLPSVVKRLYLASNGGVPDLYVFENDVIDTVISEFLPLYSQDHDDALSCYKQLVVELGLLDGEYFPFAVDGGGDYFFCDTKTEKGMVYLYRNDTDDPSPLISLNLGFDEFWEALKPE